MQQQEEAETALSEGEEAAVPPMAATASRIHRVSTEANACVNSQALGLSFTLIARSNVQPSASAPLTGTGDSCHALHESTYACQEQHRLHGLSGGCLSCLTSPAGLSPCPSAPAEDLFPSCGLAAILLADPVQEFRPPQDLQLPPEPSAEALLRQRPYPARTAAGQYWSAGGHLPREPFQVVPGNGSTGNAPECALAKPRLGGTAKVMAQLQRLQVHLHSAVDPACNVLHNWCCLHDCLRPGHLQGLLVAHNGRLLMSGWSLLLSSIVLSQYFLLSHMPVGLLAQQCHCLLLERQPQQLDPRPCLHRPSFPLPAPNATHASAEA